MSNRTLVELNHDYCPRDHELLEWAEKLRTYMRSGDKSYLPKGVVFKGQRHHSEPEFSEEQERAFMSAEEFWSRWIGATRGKPNAPKPFTIQLERAWKFAEAYAQYLLEHARSKK